MSVLRAVSLFLLLASVSPAATPRTVLRTMQHRPSETRSCELMFVAVDGKSFGSPKQRLSLPPGRHSLSIRMWFLVKGRLDTVDIPWAQSFKAHAYMIDGGFLPNGQFQLRIEDENERPPGVRLPKMK